MGIAFTPTRRLHGIHGEALLLHFLHCLQGGVEMTTRYIFNRPTRSLFQFVVRRVRGKTTRDYFGDQSCLSRAEE